LKELDCSDNKLTDLNLSNCLQLEKLYCSNNSLTNLNSLLSSLKHEKIKELDLSNNNFKGNLNNFSKFTNLTILDISNNNFTNSLEPLQNLTKLKELNITNTNIKSGLEYLPSSLEIFQCYDPDYEKPFKSTTLYKVELHSFNGNLKI
jgi:Leucine-rich repeat (LRR) protein